MNYYYIVNNLNTTVFDSQFLGWIKEYEKANIYFDVILIPTGIKSYVKNFRATYKKSSVISKSIKGKVYHTCPSSFVSGFIVFALLVILFKSILTRSKIVIQVTSPSWNVALKWVKMLHPNTIIIYNAIGASAEKYLLSNLDNRTKQEQYYRVLNNQLKQVHMADKVIVVSNKLKQYLKDKDDTIKEQKIEVVSCSADDEVFYYDNSLRNSIRKKLNIQDKKVFIYCGSLDKPWQIPDFIFKVYSILSNKYNNAFFICLTPHSNIVESYIEKYNIDPKSVWVKYVNNSEINQYLCAADMGFLFRKNSPINKVAAPTKFSEYVLAGLPVIISNQIGDFSEYVEAEKNGIVINYDINDLKVKLNNIDLSNYNRFKIANLGKINFSKRVYFERSINIYKELYFVKSK